MPLPLKKHGIMVETCTCYAVLVQFSPRRLKSKYNKEIKGPSKNIYMVMPGDNVHSFLL